LQPKEIEELQKWFKSVDRDNSGKISKDELARMTLPGQEGAAWKGNFFLLIHDTDPLKGERWVNWVQRSY